MSVQWIRTRPVLPAAAESDPGVGGRSASRPAAKPVAARQKRPARRMRFVAVFMPDPIEPGLAHLVPRAQTSVSRGVPGPTVSYIPTVRPSCPEPKNRWDGHVPNGDDP